MTPEVTFLNYKCILVFQQYNNQRIAIELREIGTMEPIAMATVNMPDANLKQDEVCIKDYSENEGMVDTLVKAGVISEPIRIIQTGYVNIPVCKLLISPYGN